MNNQANNTIHRTDPTQEQTHTPLPNQTISAPHHQPKPPKTRNNTNQKSPIPAKSCNSGRKTPEFQVLSETLYALHDFKFFVDIKAHPSSIEQHGRI